MSKSDAHATDHIAADMFLMRELFLEAIGPVESKPKPANSKLAHSSASLDRLPQGVPMMRLASQSNLDHLDGTPRLSNNVGDLLKEVEAMTDNVEALAPIAKKVESMDPDTLLSSAQLFGELLTQSNLALSQQTVRAWKANLRADAGAEEDVSAGAVVGNPTFRSAFDGLLNKGYSPSQIRDAIMGQDIELVLTAHPTEAQRRTILKKHQRIVELLGKYDTGKTTMTPGEVSELKEMISREQVAAWRTSNVRRSKPSAEGEARNGMMVIEETCWDAVPEHYRRIDRSLGRLGQPPLPYDTSVVRISTWMGGDRDGNPNVTSSVTDKVNMLMRARAAELYYKEVEKLLFELSHTGPISVEMREAVEVYTGKIEAGVRKKVFTQNANYGVHWNFQSGCPDDEPYRVLLMSIRRRLYKTKMRMEEMYMGGSREAVDPDVITSSGALLEPLEIMYRSLIAVGDRVLADGTLLDLIRRVRTFGISMAKLDLRQESDRHAEALDAITRYLGLGSYLAWDESAKIAWLEAELVSKRPLIPDLASLAASKNVTEVLETFYVLATLPHECMGAYCISMARAASDVLAVRLLQVKCGVANPMRVAPLFETREDLQNAPGVMRRVLSVAAYKGIIGGEGTHEGRI